MTVTIEHVRHRLAPAADDPLPWEVQLYRTVCGRRLIGTVDSDRNTRHHQPASHRCGRCWP